MASRSVFEQRIEWLLGLGGGGQERGELVAVEVKGLFQLPEGGQTAAFI